MDVEAEMSVFSKLTKENVLLDSGLYNLVISMPSDKFVQIGKLGKILFKKGYYVYTGSAKRGMSARIARHIRKEKTLYWHIDYLLKEAILVDARVYDLQALTECGLNERIFKMQDARLLVPGFGSSDCRCRSHLSYSEILPNIDYLGGKLFR